MLKKILLVGATGYLGRHLCTYLDKIGSEVFITGSRISKQPNYFQIDFEDPKSYNSLKSYKFDLIIVLAAKLSSISSTNLSHPDLAVNTIGYASFLQYLKDHDITQKVIYISSMTVYAPVEQPPVCEEDKIGPVSTYGLSKYMGECITTFFGQSSAVVCVILRLPGIYGGDKKSGFIYNMIYKLKNNIPIQLSTKNLIYWETIHIDDLCEMIGSFIERYAWKERTNIFNVCYGMETDFYNTFEFIKAQTLSNKGELYEEKKGYEPFFLSNKKLKGLIPVKEDYYGKLAAYIKSV
ncbi:MAG: NAD(P)-dependent oxidoreductase [Daejeonella sp.]|uniref:NAD-dependent epimerase/dehydratase family protein n=1 Tax=Daejeonella sp. TaxID=2805397 RepID=UPI002737470E|nr:NAD(P)-dependent oxidoreductase [Daejeonella sp.]MDP3467528.1 NAD(P)-dependent oxidoreductase [Daejeonella sp.]